MLQRIINLSSCLLAVLSSWALGQPWSPAVNLTNTPGGSYLAANNARSLVAYQDRLYLVWYDFPSNFGSRILFKHYNGSLWSDTATVGYLGNSRLNNWYPSGAADAGGGFHLVWESNEFTTDIENYEVAYRSYRNNLWSGVIRLTQSSGPSTNPSIAIAGDGQIFIFWQDRRAGTYRIYYRVLSGSSWGPETLLGENPDYCGMPAAATYLGWPVVVWEDWTADGFQIRFRRMTSAGWGQDSLISHSPQGAFAPAIACDNSGYIYAAWQDWSLNSSRVVCRRFEPATGSEGRWLEEIEVSSPGFRVEGPVIACRDTSADIFWADDRTGHYEIFHRTSSAGGGWGPEERLTDLRTSSLLPAAAADSRGNLHLAWSGDQLLPSYSPDIFLMSLWQNPWPGKGVAEPEAKPICRVSHHPNPASYYSRIEYSVMTPAGSSQGASLREAVVRLEIYNISGQLVRTLYAGSAPQGEGRVRWDCRDNRGQIVPSGVYLARLSSGGSHSTEKITVVR